MGLPGLAHIPLNNFMLFSALLMKEKFHQFLRSWNERLLIIIENFFRLSNKKSPKSSIFSTGLPKKNISNFETGLIPTVQIEFPNAIHWGCYFHFTRAIFRKIQISGLQIPYRRDENFEKNFWKIMSVGFLPLGEIRNAIVDLLDEEPTRTLFFRYPEL